MNGSSENGRYLVVGDLGQLGPSMVEALAPSRIEGVRTMLEGIAELPRKATRGVLVGHDEACRRPVEAMAALRRAAGEARVIFCCPPAREDVGQEMVAQGADDYVILPLERMDLIRAFGASSDSLGESEPAQASQRPDPLEELADAIPGLLGNRPGMLDRIAALIGEAIGAESVLVSMDQQVGRAGEDREVREALLVQTITRQGEKIGFIRAGRSRAGGYTIDDIQRLRGYAGVLGRLAEAAAQSERWRQLALADELTGLPNRRHLMEFLGATLQTAGAAGQIVTALVFDIDDFKRYNDRYGHDAGDEILCEVGRLFVQCSRRTDMVARYGGDEFVVVFWDPEGPRAAGSRHPAGVLMVLQRFRAALKKHRFTRLGQDSQGALTISGGLAHFPMQAKNVTDLLEAADRALLKAKEAGKNRFYILGGDESSTSIV